MIYMYIYIYTIKQVYTRTGLHCFLRLAHALYRSRRGTAPSFEAMPGLCCFLCVRNSRMGMCIGMRPYAPGHQEPGHQVPTLTCLGLCGVARGFCAGGAQACCAGG